MPEIVDGYRTPRADRVAWGLPDVVVAWIVGTVASIVAVAPFLDPKVPQSRQVGALLVALLAQSAGTAATLVWIARRKGLGSLAADFGLRLRVRDWWWITLGVGVAIGASLMVAPITEVAHLHKSTQDVVRVFKHAQGLELPFFALGVAVVAPIVEELLFRGALLRSLMRRTNPTVAVFTSALIFALIHVVGDTGTAYYVPAFLMLGLISGWRAVTTRNLSQSIYLHIGFNLLATILILI